MVINKSLDISITYTFLGEIANHCASCIGTVLIMQLHW